MRCERCGHLVHPVAVTPGQEQEQVDRVALVSRATERAMALEAQYGQPQLVGWRNDWTAVYRHASEAGAQAFARANVELYGHQVAVERDHLGWLEVIDMSRAIVAQQAESRAQFANGDSAPGDS